MRVQHSQTSLPRAAPYQYETKLGDLPALTGDVKADYAALRRFVEETHRAGGSGHTVVRLQSAAMDRIVVAIWQRAVGEALVKHKPSALSLVALGGYGRRELAPYSDLDLLVLHRPGAPDAFTKMASERFLYSLWDLRLEVGYGVRDVKACDEVPSSVTAGHARRGYFDTSKFGKSAVGHTFPDVLDEAQKRAVLEYLKTL